MVYRVFEMLFVIGFTAVPLSVGAGLVALAWPRSASHTSMPVADTVNG